MGCDIHMFIEYSDFTGQDGEPHWSTFGGECGPGRDYKMFGLMAGVRGREELYQPKGLPDGKMSHRADSYMWILINDEYAEKGYEGYTSLAQAQSWREEIENDKDGKPRRVKNPDLHSHTWLTLSEYRHILNHYKVGDKADHITAEGEDREAALQAAAALVGSQDFYDIGYDAVLAVMETFAARGWPTRLIICFDN